jgi:hypothetical protein
MMPTTLHPVLAQPQKSKFDRKKASLCALKIETRNLTLIEAPGSAAARSGAAEGRRQAAAATTEPTACPDIRARTRTAAIGIAEREEEEKERFDCGGRNLGDEATAAKGLEGFWLLGEGDVCAKDRFALRCFAQVEVGGGSVSGALWLFVRNVDVSCKKNREADVEIINSLCNKL